MPTSDAIGEHFERFIEGQVRTGRYASASEVVRAALALLERREREPLGLRAEIRKGLDSGAGKPADEAFARLEAKYAAMADEQSVTTVRCSEQGVANSTRQSGEARFRHPMSRAASRCAGDRPSPDERRSLSENSRGADI